MAKLLQLLEQDCTLTPEQLASMTDMTAEDVKAAIKRYEEEKIILGYQAIVDWDRTQREAVTATEGFVRVIAGAGSGKTRALTHRFAFLVGELGILPGNILCVTFTNKSAAEMRQRIHQLTGDNDTGFINTFHGFCVSVLQGRRTLQIYS